MLLVFIIRAFEQVFDHFHDVLDCLQVAPQLGFVIQIFFAHILLSLSDVFQGDAVQIVFVESSLQLALLGHLFAETEELISALLVVHVSDVVVEEVSDAMDQIFAR